MPMGFYFGFRLQQSVLCVSVMLVCNLKTWGEEILH